MSIRLLALLCFVVGIGITLLEFPTGAVAVLVCTVLTLVALYVIYQAPEEDREFLVQVFLIALLARVVLGSTIYFFGWSEFFGGDVTTYDYLGRRLAEIWEGKDLYWDYHERATSTVETGWGMYRLVAVVYYLVGRNILAVQMVSCVVGAATAPAIYFCSYRIFNNKRVARISAFMVALFPSLIIWSCQMLKDGYIVFLLVMVMFAVLQLQKKFSYAFLVVLIMSLFGIVTLRFYIFYMLMVAVVGSFLIGSSRSTQSIVVRIAALVVIGMGLTYMGILQDASYNFDKYASFERVQAARGDLSKASSGFGEDLDVSTPAGAISAIPIGFVYIMFAPFPWMVTNLRVAITMPEMILWWCSLPLFVVGLIYAVRHRFRNTIAILIFTLMLTISYSIFQGNVGTAYRQRAQIQVFMFMFIAVGYTLIQEKRENQKLQHKIDKRRIDQRLRAKALES